MTIRCSSLPALSQSPCFESEASDATEAGTERHDAMRTALEGNDFLLEALEEEDQEGVRWALDYIRCHAKTALHAMQCEKPVQASIGDDKLTGTPDVTCGPDIFDLKWRSEADYKPQMAGYALLRFLNRAPAAEYPPEEQVITVHVLHAAFKRAQTFTFTLDEAKAIVETIFRTAYAAQNQTPSFWCGWCAKPKRATCPALNAMAQTVGINREDWQIATYHSSQIEKPEEMAKALRLASYLEKWAEAVKYHALQLHLKKGVTIPGYELRTKAGKSSCANVLGAFNTTGLPANDFLACCEIRMGADPKNPAKKALIPTYAKANGISKAEAKRRLKTKLQDHMRTAKETQYLKAVDAAEDQETEAIDA